MPRDILHANTLTEIYYMLHFLPKNPNQDSALEVLSFIYVFYTFSVTEICFTIKINISPMRKIT